MTIINIKYQLAQNCKIEYEPTGMFRIKRNDTLPALQINITTYGDLGQKTPYDLTTASGITFSMKDDYGNLKVFEQTAQISCASGGTIQYQWQNGDTDTAGTYYGEFEISFSGGTRLSIPQTDGIRIEIPKDINQFN